MNFLQYNLTALTSYLGLIAGLIIMRASKEEQKASRKFFIILQKVIFLLIIIFLLYFFNINIIINIVILIILSTIIILNHKKKKLTESYSIYPILGFIFYLSKDNQQLFLIESVLIFIYGLITASLLINFKKKNYLEIILKHASFLVIAILFNFLVMS